MCSCDWPTKVAAQTNGGSACHQRCAPCIHSGTQDNRCLLVPHLQFAYRWTSRILCVHLRSWSATMCLMSSLLERRRSTKRWSMPKEYHVQLIGDERTTLCSRLAPLQSHSSASASSKRAGIGVADCSRLGVQRMAGAKPCWSCGPAASYPTSAPHWSMQALAGMLVELRIVETISDDTVRRTLNQTTSSLG